MTQPKKLIEVAMPIKEISAESVRDKSIRHGHISTLHLWWARRPLPVCRAVVFASLVPDPLDENCPQAFKDAVRILLNTKDDQGDPYKPYDDIPYTAGIDRMEDNLRNRLLMFIGKFSDTYIRNEHQGKSTAAKDQLSAFSLIKWDNKNDEQIINKARKLIWVSHNASSGKNAIDLMADFDAHYEAIREAERSLYNTTDRHLSNPDIIKKESKLHQAIEDFLNWMPKVFDPFAGGGAIPLEAARLGCRSYGNDINPVAHIIQKGSLEFPQKFGKPIVYSKDEFIRLYGEETWKQQPQENYVSKGNAITGIRIHNRLSFDVEHFAKKLLTKAEKEIGHLYPADEKGNKPIAYIWARTAKCSNPSCQVDVPLLRDFYVCEKPDKKFYLKPSLQSNEIKFSIAKGKHDLEGWVKRANLTCPCCGSLTDVKTLKEQFLLKRTGEILLCVIYDSINGKEYRLPTNSELILSKSKHNIFDRPTEQLEIGNNRNFNTPGWGIDKFGEMFSDRQMLAMLTLVQSLQAIKKEFKHGDPDYYLAILTMLGIFIDRISSRMTSLGLWHTKGEKLEQPFGRQAIPMVFDYPESNPFAESGGGALNQLEWLKKYIDSEGTLQFYTVCNHASSGDKNQFNNKELKAVITDPPYYDAIAYADLADFYYVWLKRTLGEDFPLNFATPKTPKEDECTALKHHHNNDISEAKRHFENKLSSIFKALEFQTSDIVSIMFAHQSTEAWTTLCNSILGANMNITGSWATDTELIGALKKDMSALSSSVTVSCKPINRYGTGSFQEVKKSIEKKIAYEVPFLYRLGFRGADLLTACFGQAVSVFGMYNFVEKADGSKVSVEELLILAKESAFNALLKGFAGDDFTKFYIGWLQLYGFTESDFDDAAKFSRVGLTIDVSDLFRDHILLKNGNKQSLAGYKVRNRASKNLGDKPDSHLIDQVHRIMMLYEGKDRKALLHYLSKVASNPDAPFWRVVTSLVEVLPPGSDDQKASLDLLANKENLIRESREAQKGAGEQTKLEL